jgi:ribonuclease HI
LHAHVLPVHIRLNRSAFNAGTRLVTLPSNPIRRVLLRCCNVPRFHRSPIHHLISAFPVFRSEFETIDPQRRLAPLPAGALSTHIADSKDKARANMERIVAGGGFCVFTDGSGFEGGVGAAAAAMKGGEMGEQCTKHLGTGGEHTVFEAEVCGAILALDIVTGTPRLTSVDVFMDCQPAITALNTSSPLSTPSSLARLCRVRRTLKVRIHWVPAHVGIAGNGAVDACAKDAAQGSSSPLFSLIKLFEAALPISRAATIASGTKAFAARWGDE